MRRTGLTTRHPLRGKYGGESENAAAHLLLGQYIRKHQHVLNAVALLYHAVNPVRYISINQLLDHAHPPAVCLLLVTRFQSHARLAVATVVDVGITVGFGHESCREEKARRIGKTLG